MTKYALGTILAITLHLSTPFASADSNYGSCAACSSYQSAAVGGSGNAMSMQSVVDHCGPVPNASAATGGVSASNQGMDPNFKSGDTNWDTCYGGWIASWQELGNYCSAVDQTNTAHDWQQDAAIAYTVAGVICTFNCAMQAGWATAAWAKANEYICTGAALAAAGVDIKADTTLGQDFSKDLEGWGSALGFAGAGLDTLMTVARVTATATAEAGKTVSTTTAGAYVACIAAGVTDVAAGLKWASLGPIGDSTKKNCDSATSVFSNANSLSAQATSTSNPSTGGGSGGSNISGGGGAQGRGGSSGLTITGSRLSSGVQAFVKNPWDPQYAAATAGPLAPLLSNMPSDQIQNALQQVGASVGDIANRLANGQSPSSIISDLSGMPTQAASALQSMEKDFTSGKLQAPAGFGGSGTYASKNVASAHAAAKPNPFGMLGMKGPASIGVGGAPTETTFDKAKRDLASSESSGDIWHEGFGGTIFQIVSGKLDKTRDRVDQLEWDTPLNRALVGLPAHKTGAVGTTTHP